VSLALRRRVGLVFVVLVVGRPAPDEELLVAVLLGLDGDLVVNRLGAHQDDAVLAGRLQPMLRLLFVADHQQRLLRLNQLQGRLLRGDLVGEAKRVLASLLLELLHVFDDVVHFAAAVEVALSQELVGVRLAHVPRVDFLQVREFVLVGLLHILQKRFVLL